ncbi:MAG: sugar phosphate isomerase/epimerase family protein [Bryobacteraceae bacterium]
MISQTSRRQFLASLAAPLIGAPLLAASASGLASAAPRKSPHSSKMAVEGYIFEQYAQRLHKPLESIMEQVLSMARDAGFKNIELAPAFFPPDGREKTLSILRAQHLRMLSVYVGGVLHEKAGADKTIQRALEFADLCHPFGCKAVVTNPDPKPGGVPKTDAELAVQAESLNRMGRTLERHGFGLRVHHHTPQLADHAREWHHILRHTDPQYVHICVDVDWAYESGFKPVPFLRNVGDRLREIHVRSAKNKVWLEDLEDSDIDYRKVAAYLKETDLHPLIIVELAYRPNTVITRPLEEDLRRSRVYAEKIFGVKANS